MHLILSLIPLTVTLCVFNTAVPVLRSNLSLHFYLLLIGIAPTVKHGLALMLKAHGR